MGPLGHINACNTNVGVPQDKSISVFTQRKWTQYPPKNIFSCREYSKAIEVVFAKIHELQTRGTLMQGGGGGGYFHDTTFRTQNPSIFPFLFYLLINQNEKYGNINCEYQFLRCLMQLKYRN